MTKEWQNWKAYETQANSPQREESKNAVKEKLAQIEQNIDNRILMLGLKMSNMSLTFIEQKLKKNKIFKSKKKSDLLVSGRIFVCRKNTILSHH